MVVKIDFNRCSGQVMATIEGTSLTADDRALLSHPTLGGVLLFSRNYHNVDQLKGLVQSMRALRPSLLIAVDQEGGRVQRFREGFTELMPLGEIGQHYDAGHTVQALALARAQATTMATELMAVGIDFSFAPVLDLNKGRNTVIGNRSFSAHPNTVIALASAYIEALHAVGMPAVGKHFPGHGSTAMDSHFKIAEDTQSYEALCQSDLLPFKVLLPYLDAVMPAHVIYPAVDAEHPAGFSKRWLKKILKTQLGFKGFIFSDDLMMEGAAVAGTPLERASQALSAGCNMILVCNNREVAWQVLRHLS